MIRTRKVRRRPVLVIGTPEQLEGRCVPSAPGRLSPLLLHPVAYPAHRPNTPVMPFAVPSKIGSYIDPTVAVPNGSSVVVGYQNFVGPYAQLDSRGGAIKIGDASDVLDNASIVAHPSRRGPATTVLIGNSVVIGFGAAVEGPSTIGAFGSAAKPTAIGAGALIDGATIAPGAIVSPRARVGPGVTVPSGVRVLPGANVTTDAEAKDPALGFVVPVTSSDVATIQKTLSENQSLSTGYNQLYQGTSATGVNPGANPAISGIFNGNLAAVLGIGFDPGPSSASFEKSKAAPEFLSPFLGLVQVTLNTFPGRITGAVSINMRVGQAAHHLGRANAIRGDQGGPITIGSIAHTGRHVTINAPLGGTLTIGQNFQAGDGAVILGGPNVNAKIGDNVTVGPKAVLDRTSLGSGASVGAGAYLFNSSFPANTVIPANAIYINNKLVGSVQW
jgi:carbonic anhydrase/acetyltransferase-like protein (isoleucine patch superfamily)